MLRRRALSNRNAKGRGWHKKGYREHGSIHFQLKYSYSAWTFSREAWENEHATVTEFNQNMLRRVSDEDIPRAPNYLSYGFYYKGLTCDSDEMIKHVLDGGETNNVKVARVTDDTGHQWIYYGRERVSRDDWDWGTNSAGWDRSFHATNEPIKMLVLRQNRAQR